MKRLIAGTVAALLAAVLFFPVDARAHSARSACVYDPVTETMVFSHRENSRGLMASTTKIMTALVVCEQCNVLDRMRIPEEAVGVEGSSMYLQAGEVLTLQELLYGLMLHSGNDAAVALAIYCGGTMEGFVQRMNDKARVLGLRDTHFDNPHGLDSPGQYSTARDLAVLASHAMENPVFRKTVSAKTVRVGDRHLTNHNKLLWRVEGADGVKTGYTLAAGRILVSSVLRQNRRLIAVTMDDPRDWQDHEAFFEEGFGRYTLQNVVRAGEEIGSVEVESGENSRVSLLAAEDVSYPLAPGEEPCLMLPGSGFVYAPAVAGADAGYAYVLLQGNAVEKFPVVYGQTVEAEQEEERSFWGRLFS